MKQDCPRVLRRFALSIIPPKLHPRISFTCIPRFIILWSDSNITLSPPAPLEKNLWQLSKVTGRQALCSRHAQSFFYSQLYPSLLWGPPVSWVLGAHFSGMKRQGGGVHLIASPPWRTSATSLPIILCLHCERKLFSSSTRTFSISLKRYQHPTPHPAVRHLPTYTASPPIRQ